MSIPQPLKSSLTAGSYREFDAVPSGHLPALDGMRGLAILLVFCYDCLKIPNDGGLISLGTRTICSAGWTGVDLFFVLSGFLISGILLDTRGRKNYFFSFFGRRAVRIFPLYYVALISAFWIVPAMLSRWAPGSPVLTELQTLRNDQVWFWSYLQNWMMVSRGDWQEISYLNHFWSLAIEEQFYFVWPVVVAFMSRRRLAILSVLLCGMALGLRCWLKSSGANPAELHVCTFTRIDSLCYGALAAILIRDPRWYLRLRRLAFPVFCGLGLLLFGLNRWQPILQTAMPLTQTLGHTLLGVMFAAFVYWAATLQDSTVAARLLSLRFLTLLGQYSYALYVLHRPVHVLVKGLSLSELPVSLFSLRPLNDTGTGVAEFIATLAVSLAVAWCSWHLIEKHFLALKRYFPRPAPNPSAIEIKAVTTSETAAVEVVHASA